MLLKIWPRGRTMRWDMVDFMILIISFSHHFPTLLDLVDLEDIVSVAQWLFCRLGRTRLYGEGVC